MPCQDFDYYEEHEAQKRADWENLRSLISECGGEWIYSSEYGNISFQEMTARLCSLCKDIPDMSKMSHKMQNWWLWHREFDELREARNKQQMLEVGKRMRENRIIVASLGDTTSFTRLLK